MDRHGGGQSVPAITHVATGAAWVPVPLSSRIRTRSFCVATRGSALPMHHSIVETFRHKWVREVKWFANRIRIASRCASFSPVS